MRLKWCLKHVWLPIIMRSSSFPSSCFLWIFIVQQQKKIASKTEWVLNRKHILNVMIHIFHHYGNHRMQFDSRNKKHRQSGTRRWFNFLFRFFYWIRKMKFDKQTIERLCIGTKWELDITSSFPKKRNKCYAHELFFIIQANVSMYLCSQQKKWKTKQKKRKNLVHFWARK